MSQLTRAAAYSGCALVAAGLVYAQRGGGDWTTIGYDAQRSFWVRGDVKISPESMSKPGFQLVWKLPLNNQARQMNAVTPPALIDFYIGYKGFRTLGFFGGSSNKVIAIDTDLARLEWEKSFGALSAAGTIPCPGGMTSAVTRPTTTAYQSALVARGFGRGGPAKSGVGLPNEGAVTLRQIPVIPNPPPAATPPNRRTAPPPNPFARLPQFVYVLSADGKLHAMYLSNGEEPKPAIAFLPPNAHAQGLIVFDNMAFAATVNGCGGVPDSVFALNLEKGTVTKWQAGGPIAGSVGPAAAPDGTLYVTAGSDLVALDSTTLKSKATYAAGSPFTSSPVIFDHNGKDLIAAATADGKLHLVDTASMSKALFQTPAFSAPGYATGALSSWLDGNGTRWILAPSGGTVASSLSTANGAIQAGAIVAWKLVDKGGSLELQAGWVSRNLVSPLPPAIVNGVVFALSSGEMRSNDAKLTAAQRAQRSSRAVLYALEADTGKELWNSGADIADFVHSGGLAAGGGRVYVSGHNGTQYAFGFPMEH